MLALLAPIALALPTWEALQPIEHDPSLSASFAPDGTGLLWQERAGNQVVVHLRWLPDGPESTLPVELPAEGRVVTRWALPAEPRAIVIEGDQQTHHAWRPGGWEEVDAATARWPGFAAAPGATLHWEREGGHRYTLTRSVHDTVTDTWAVRFRPHDRPLWDIEGHLRAVGSPTRRGYRYRAVDDRPLQIPRYVLRPDPYRGRDEVRRPSRPLTVLGDTLWALESRGHEHTAVVTVDLTTGAQTTVYEAPDADVFGVMTDPDTGVPDLALVFDAIPRWVALDPELADDLRWVQQALPRPARLARAHGDRRWHACGAGAEGETSSRSEAPGAERSEAVEASRDRVEVGGETSSRSEAPGAERSEAMEASRDRVEGEGTVCAYFDRDAHELVPTLSAPLVRGPAEVRAARPVILHTDDGLELDSYLILPPDAPAGPLPAVVLVHGGPFGRVHHTYRPLRAFLASRGYAVLDVNYRGSTMLGRAVLDAGTGERGRAIERDVEAARDWLVAEGVADPERVAVMGHSYGGYSALLQLARSPDRWACGVALAPQAGWSYRWLVWALPRSLKRRAPYTQLRHVQDPLLLVHGRDDDVIGVSESRHVARVLERRGEPVTLVEVDDGHALEGDGVPAMIANAVEGFLAGCLGGDRGPLEPDRWPDSARVVVGAEHLAP